MENWSGAIILVCGGGIIATAVVTSILLYRHILDPRPKRDLTINSNIWSLTLPATCFIDTGQKIRKVALSVGVSLISVAVVTLAYVGSVLWFG